MQRFFGTFFSIWILARIILFFIFILILLLAKPQIIFAQDIPWCSPQTEGICTPFSCPASGPWHPSWTVTCSNLQLSDGSSGHICCEEAPLPACIPAYQSCDVNNPCCSPNICSGGYCTPTCTPVITTVCTGGCFGCTYGETGELATYNSCGETITYSCDPACADYCPVPTPTPTSTPVPGASPTPTSTPIPTSTPTPVPFEFR